MDNKLVVNGQLVEDVTVYVAFPKKRAPFKRFALLNLNAQKLNLHLLSGQEAKVLLSLLFLNKDTVRLKELALAVGIPTTSARRSLRRLLELGLVEQTAHGKYRCSRVLRYFGCWASEGAEKD